MIDLTRIDSEDVSTDPYKWAHIDKLFAPSDRGCLTIPRSSDMSDVKAEVPPVVGNSVVLVRSNDFWHAVSRVVDGSETSRRSVTVTFYKPGAVSTMWPPGEEPALHPYPPAS